MAASDILGRAQAGRHVVQDFCSFADSLEWGIGQAYLRGRGSSAFISDSVRVPFAVNNDGVFAAQAAEVLFEQCRAWKEDLPEQIVVLEIGIGLGLFARFFLDHFRSLCGQENADFYGRVRYVLGDYSDRMLLDVLRHGVMDGHLSKWHARVVDARDPASAFPDNGGLRPFHAVILNYLLDCLPASVLRAEAGQLKQLCVRTCLGRNARLSDYTQRTPKELAELAKSQEPRAREELDRLADLFAAEYAFMPVDPGSVPYLDSAPVPDGTTRVHSHGAIDALEKLVPMLSDGGFIMINDYGSTEAEAGSDFEHQRYSGATFVGVNFGLLKRHFEGRPDVTWVEPKTDNPSMHSRLLARPGLPESAKDRFTTLFDQPHFEAVRKPHAVARKLIESRRFESAGNVFREAMLKQPYNWMLQDEVAKYLAISLQEPAAGLEIVRAALELNRACSSELWNTAGDCLRALKRRDDARDAFRRALEINPNDVRAVFNLASIHVEHRESETALTAIAKGLAMDQSEQYRKAFLQLQNDLLIALSQVHARQQYQLVNRVRVLGQAPEATLPGTS